MTKSCSWSNFELSHKMCAITPIRCDNDRACLTMQFVEMGLSDVYHEIAWEMQVSEGIHAVYMTSVECVKFGNTRVIEAKE